MIILQEHLDFLRERRIFINADGSYDKSWFSIGKNYDHKPKVMIESYTAQFASAFMSLGAFSYSSSRIGAGSSVGRYCAISGTVGPLGSRHPVDRVGLSGFDYTKQAPFGQFAHDRGHEQKIRPYDEAFNEPRIVVDDDVWIGSGVLLARQIHVGQGAVIAARSIVTRDVPPYAFIAGSPAQIKRMRFPDRLIERLLASHWTDYAFTDFAALPTDEPDRFLDLFEDMKAAGRIKPYPKAPFDLHAEFVRITRQATKPKE